MDIFIRTKRYTGPVQALVLDWAGTAVDYGCLGPMAVFLDVFAKYGVQVTLDEARAFMGLMKKDHIRSMCRTPSVMDKWEAAHGRVPNESDVEAMYQKTEPMMVGVIAKHADLIPGLLEAVDAFKAMDIKIGTSTGYTGSMMDVLVPEAAKKGYSPDSVVCSTDVPAGRPFPWMCYQNAINLEVYPMEAMVKIGDTISDIQEGRNAGMWTIGLTRSGNELGLPKAEADALDSADLAARLKGIEERYFEAGAHYVVEDISHCPQLMAEINHRLAQGELPLP
ncbi:MAG: phosphonoacetaldehyde hydrolase [Desulfovibrio sp.]|nr:MAG: phosphonoacetaldehyde hydrolase [Desulfovibrio sp.]